MKRSRFILYYITLLFFLIPGSVFSDVYTTLPVYEYWADENYPPFEFKDADGNAAGFSVDIIKAIAKEEGFEVRVTPRPWSDIAAALSNDSIDFSGTMAYDITRTDRFSFSVPIITLNWYLYVPDTSPIKSLDDIRGKKIVLAKGDIWEEKMRQNNYSAELFIAPDYREQLTLLSQGTYDAAIINKPVASYLMEELGISNIKPVGDPIDRLKLCIASHFSHPERIAMINEGIVIINRNGLFNQIQNSWFAPLERQYETELYRNVFFYVILPSFFVIILILLWLWSVRRMVVIRTAELQRELSERLKIEKELIASEKRYSTTLESINDGLWDLDIKTRKTFFSPQYYRMAGYEPGEFAADYENWHSRIHESDVHLVDGALHQAIESGGSKYQVEFRFKRRDGSYMWILTRGKVVELDEDGKPARMVGTHTDISELKAAENRLGESQRALRTLIDNLPGMVYRCRNDPDWTMVFISDGVLSLTGYSVDEVLNNQRISYAMIIHPDDRDMVWNYVQKGVEDSNPYQVMYRIICKSGVQKWVWEQGRGVFQDDQLVSLEGYITDITTEKETLEALRKMEYSLEHLNEGIFWFDAEGRIFDANIAFLDLMNITRSMVQGSHVFSLPLNISIEVWYEIMDCAKTHGSSVSEVEIQTGSIKKYLQINTSYCEFETERVFCSIIEDRTVELLSRDEIIAQKENLTLFNQELLQSEEELRQKYEELDYTKQALQISEKKYRAIFEDAVLGIFQTDHQGTMIECNTAFARIFGFQNPDEMKGSMNNWGEMSFNFSDGWKNLLKQVDDIGEITGFELQEMRNDGTAVWISVNVKAVSGDDGKTILHEGSVEDITRRILAEQENERSFNQIKKNIAELALINDRVRNPLTVIDIISDEMESGKKEIIKDQISKIDSLITTLDKRWIESLSIIQYLKKHHDIHFSEDIEKNS